MPSVGVGPAAERRKTNGCWCISAPAIAPAERPTGIGGSITSCVSRRASSPRWKRRA